MSDIVGPGAAQTLALNLFADTGDHLSQEGSGACRRIKNQHRMPFAVRHPSLGEPIDKPEAFA